MRRESKWAIGILLGLLGVSAAANGYLIWKMREEWRIIEVLDGDTLRLPSRQKIRIAGMDAPELGECMGQEAKERLAGLVEGKAIGFDDRGWDMYERRLGRVLAGNKDVAEIMLAEGLGEYEWGENLDIKRLKAARDSAYAASKGIWSQECGYKKQGEKAPMGCEIVGNNNHGKKVYLMPGCPNYGQLKMEPVKGDKYFCSEEEASRAGYFKAENCGS